MNNMNPEADILAEGWGNSMMEAYTGNHTGHRVSRKHQEDEAFLPPV
jgi:hypothetical protein